MKKAIIFLIIILLVDAVGVLRYWYLAYEWIDIPLHLLGGFFVAMFFFNYLKEYFAGKSKFKNTLILVGVTVFIGVLWEFAEYGANRFLEEPIYHAYNFRAYFMGDITDTMIDLLNDILGALFFSSLHFFQKNERIK